MDNYYIYTYKDSKYTYDRTLPSKRYAEERVKELKERKLYDHIVYTINHIIKGAYY